jgi:translation elongation factor EF-G
MREGSDLFSIHAYLPAQASFGFANDMRRQSSGLCHGLFHLHALLCEGAINLAARMCIQSCMLLFPLCCL